jgi:hypothetical protein
MKRQEKSTTVRRVIVNEFGGAEQLRVESAVPDTLVSSTTYQKE